MSKMETKQSNMIYMCLYHDEIFNEIKPAMKHEEDNGKCCCIIVKKKELEKFRSLIYNERPMRQYR